MWGMGDNIFSRPFVRAAAAKFDLWLDTPWPELYADLNIKFVRGERKLRTQLKNIRRQPANLWVSPPALRQEIIIGYGADLVNGSIINSMERRWSLFGIRFDQTL